MNKKMVSKTLSISANYNQIEELNRAYARYLFNCKDRKSLSSFFHKHVKSVIKELNDEVLKNEGSYIRP